MKTMLEDLEKHDSGVKNGLISVSQGLVYFGHPLRISKEMLKYSVETVCCIEHGAMNCVTTWKQGTLWRCIMCNEGAVLIKEGK